MIEREIEWGDLMPAKPKIRSQKFEREIDWGDIPDQQPVSNQDSGETLGWPGVAHDVYGKALGAIKSIPEFIRALPGEARGVANQFIEPGGPERIGRNLLAGTAQHGHELLSAPGNLRDYFVRKQLASPESGSFRLPEEVLPKDYDYAKALGVSASEPGDVLLQSIPGMLGAGGEFHLARKIPGLRSSKRFQNELANQERSIENANQFHRQFLGEGQEHGARAAEQFINRIEGNVNHQTGRTEGGLRREIGSQYNALENDLKNENVQIPKTPDLKAIQKAIDKLGKGVTGKEKENLFKVLSRVDSKQKVNGADALTSYRELKHQSRKAYENAYAPGDKSPETRKAWIKEGDKIRDLEHKMKKMLEEQIGGSYLERLKNIDKQYATTIAPLHENPMYQEMLKHKQTSKNMMKFLHGKTAGNETLNAIVKESPELQRLIVGQKFASNPEKISAPNEAIERYASMNPIISRIINEQKQAQHFTKNVKPVLQEKAMKAAKRRLARNAAITGSLATLGTLGGAAALETALGNDWKKDIPLLLALSKRK